MLHRARWESVEAEEGLLDDYSGLIPCGITIKP